MDTSWWLVLAAVLLLALVATLIDGWGRGHRRPGGRLRLLRRSRGAAVRPLPGEIWWALVPFEEGPESDGFARDTGTAVAGAGQRAKDRPCLVLAVRRRRVRVAKITSKYHDERAGVIALPPGSVGDARGRPSFLETDELREVPLGDFRKRVGIVDPVVWDQVRYLAG
ncbi:type II toxin-antitoxin system PemK/MazF family toxin [Streptomyces sp. NPDC046821]|uniref:type II toxin-antitoxin system PemK/MazF family toxin n=1 Tax=Streptomyces sp. NPDC046821 TaxID=3154702 RepID=UPI0033F7DF7A